MFPAIEYVVAQALAESVVLDQEVEHVALEELLQHCDVILHVKRETVEIALRVESAVRSEPVKVEEGKRSDRHSPYPRKTAAR